MEDISHIFISCCILLDVPKQEDGGWGGIRTHETLTRLLVFKTSAFNHSATHPTAVNILKVL